MVSESEQCVDSRKINFWLYPESKSLFHGEQLGLVLLLTHYIAPSTELHWNHPQDHSSQPAQMQPTAAPAYSRLGASYATCNGCLVPSLPLKRAARWGHDSAVRFPMNFPGD